MKPANCFLCGKMAVDEPANNTGEWLKFADYRPEKVGELGHPVGLEYVCKEHVHAAKSLVTKTAEEARTLLLKQFGDLQQVKKDSMEPQSSIWNRILAVFNKEA